MCQDFYGTCCPPVKQRSIGVNRSSATKRRLVYGFRGKGSLVSNFCPRKEFVSATGVRRAPSQVAALALAAKTAEAMRLETTGQWGPCANVRRSPSQGAALALAEKAAEAMRTLTDQCGLSADVRRSPSQGAMLAVAVKARNIVEVQHVLAHSGEEITQKNGSGNGDRDDRLVGAL